MMTDVAGTDTQSADMPNGDVTGGDIHRPLRPVRKRWRNFVAVSDGTPECELAIHFAALRASHITGGRLVLFHAIQPESFQHWMTVAERMKAEALAEAQDRLTAQADRIMATYGVRPRVEIRDGEAHDVLIEYLSNATDVFGLVLGAGEAGTPGPLVDYFTQQGAASLKCPVIIIPHGMTLGDIEDMA